MTSTGEPMKSVKPAQNTAMACSAKATPAQRTHLTANDAFGVLFGINDLGLGAALEVCAAPGDSGGPTFLNGMIASVVTGGITFSGAQDVLPGLNSSFGDFGMDTRVSVYADWIDGVVGTGAPEF